MKDKIILIDGNSIINRAFYGMPLYKNKNGEFVNAVYGFLNMILKIYFTEQANYIAIAFDLPVLTFRHELFLDYKANRKSMPDELRSQIKILKKILSAMKIKFFEREGFEGDDILGTLAKKFEEKNFEIIIFSGDRDFLQLATDRINIFVQVSKNHKTLIEKYNQKRICEEFEIMPKEFIDVKALMGDKSDNIPGVIGIGEKNAFKIIKKYRSIENAISNLLNAKKLTRHEKSLLENQDQALLCKKLVTIRTDMNLEINLSEIIIKDLFNQEAIRELEYFCLKGLVDKYYM